MKIGDAMKEKYSESLLYILVRPIVKVLFKLYTPKIIGKENIPKTGRIILAGNHTNNFDSLLLISSTKRCIHFLAKDELWKGYKKIIFSNLGLIPVNRREKSHHSLEMAENYLRNEKVIGIFPEGTFPKGRRELLPFKIGAIKMARDTDTMIVPFAITGTYKLFSKDLKIVFDKPISIIGNDLDKENEKLRNIINDLIVGGK